MENGYGFVNGEGFLMSEARLVEEPLPCNYACPKCGSSDAHRRYFRKGFDTSGIGPYPTEDEVGKSEFVNRKERWYQPALKECIVHTCRCCGYSWDTAPLNLDPPKE